MLPGTCWASHMLATIINQRFSSWNIYWMCESWCSLHMVPKLVHKHRKAIKHILPAREHHIRVCDECICWAEEFGNSDNSDNSSTWQRHLSCSTQRHLASLLSNNKNNWSMRLWVIYSHLYCYKPGPCAMHGNGKQIKMQTKCAEKEGNRLGMQEEQAQAQLKKNKRGNGKPVWRGSNSLEYTHE